MYYNHGSFNVTLLVVLMTLLMNARKIFNKFHHIIHNNIDFSSMIIYSLYIEG